ncbi:MAG: phosphopantetheine-binding protein [Balneolia bacterium]|nr:phosphopantetheine-binding protein [Balneolia bacterium]
MNNKSDQFMAEAALKQNATDNRVHMVLCDQLLLDSVDPDTDLFEEGLLDSMALVNLMMALEQEFSIMIAPEDLDMEDYRSMESIVSMVNRMQSI